MSAASARRWAARAEAAIAALAESAGRHPRAEEAEALGRDLRVATFGRRPHVYRVLFRYDDESVVVVRVRHAAQDALGADDL